MAVTTLAAYATFLTARWDEMGQIASNPARAPEETDDGPEEVEAWFEWDALRERQPHEAKCAWRVGEGLDGECSCGYPAYVLADLAAKRAILAHVTMQPPFLAHGDTEARAPWYIATLAEPFRDHPDHPANQEA